MTECRIAMLAAVVSLILLPASAEEPYRIAGAQMTPIYVEGQFVGIQFTHLLPDSCLADLGVREGDTLIEVYGKPMRGPADSVRFLESIRGGSIVELTLVNASGEQRSVIRKGCGPKAPGEPT